jgi:hypothetical protein
VELTAKSDQTEYKLSHSPTSEYILTIEGIYTFSMIGGSLKFSKSFAKVVSKNSVLNIKNIVLHFETSANCLVHITCGRVTVSNMTIESETSDWSYPLINTEGGISGSVVDSIIVEFLSSKVKDCNYVSALPEKSSYSTYSSIVNISNNNAFGSSIRVYINDSVFEDDTFDLSFGGSSICYFFSNSSDSSFPFLFSYLISFLVFVVNNCTFKGITQQAKSGFFFFLFFF